MAAPLPKGKPVQVKHRLLDKDFEMTAMEAASEHYTFLFILRGDRTTITPTYSYTLHAGDINAIAPLLYYRTIPASDEPYESIQIKFTPEFVEPLTRKLGFRIMDKVFENPAKHFTEEDSAKAFSLAFIMEVMGNEYEEVLANGADPEKRAYIEFKLQNVLFSILFFIYEFSKDGIRANPYKSELSKPIVDAVFYMENNYMSSITIEDAAAVAGYSSAYFSRLFKSQLGTTFSEYLTTIRLKHVQHDLLTTDKSITDISIDNGFAYPGNMTDSFKRRLGMTPYEYRKQRRTG